MICISMMVGITLSILTRAHGSMSFLLGILGLASRSAALFIADRPTLAIMSTLEK
jgi:hypothetical protein